MYTNPGLVKRKITRDLNELAKRDPSFFLADHYEAALTEIRGLKNLQITLVSDNLRRTGNDPELLEYIKVRDPKARNRNGGPSPRVDTVHNHLPLA